MIKKQRNIITLGILALLILAGGWVYFRTQQGVIPGVPTTAGVTYEIKDLTVTKDDETNVQYLEIRSGVLQPIRDRVNQQLKKVIVDASCFDDSTDPVAVGTLREVYSNQLDFRNHENMFGKPLSVTSTIISHWSYDEVVQHLITDFNYYSYIRPVAEYAVSNLLSISTNFETYCGGAHPTQGMFGMTFDLTTAKEIAFSDLFTNYNRDKQAIESAVFSYIATQLPALDGECDYLADWRLGEISADYVSYSLTAQGIKLLALGYPYAEANCEPNGEVVVPFSLLAPYLARSEPLASLFMSQVIPSH